MMPVCSAHWSLMFSSVRSWRFMTNAPINSTRNGQSGRFVIRLGTPWIITSGWLITIATRTTIQQPLTLMKCSSYIALSVILISLDPLHMLTDSLTTDQIQMGPHTVRVTLSDTPIMTIAKSITDLAGQATSVGRSKVTVSVMNSWDYQAHQTQHLVIDICPFYWLFTYTRNLTIE